MNDYPIPIRYKSGLGVLFSFVVFLRLEAEAPAGGDDNVLVC